MRLGSGESRRHRSPGRQGTAWLGMLSYLAPALMAVGGYVHYWLYRKGYRFIPTIGVTLLVQVAASAVVAAALVPVPKPGSATTHRQRLRQGAARLAGLGLSLGTLGAFWLSRTGRGLFGFQERGFNPAPQALLALLTESMAAVVLVALLVVDYQVRPRMAGLA